MKQVYQFISELTANNNREWFAAHKDEYNKATATFHSFAQRMIDMIATFDSAAAHLSVKDCT